MGMGKMALLGRTSAIGEISNRLIGRRRMGYKKRDIGSRNQPKWKTFKLTSSLLFQSKIRYCYKVA